MPSVLGVAFGPFSTKTTITHNYKLRAQEDTDVDQLINSISSILWSRPMIILCLGAGLLFSVSTRFLQVRYFKEMLRQIIAKKKSDEGISPFQSLVLSLSGRLGTGNIAGVATAIAYGGPGAIFWMWFIAFLGAGSAFAESTLGQIYKTKEKDGFRGGPAFYIEKGIGSRGYAVLFSASVILAYIIFVPGVQANTISMSVQYAFSIPPAITGVAMVISLIFLLKGGIKGYAKFSEVVIPVMAIGYILVAWIIIAVNFREVPAAFMLIMSSAFGYDEVFGGILGSAISYGIRRGVFSTEAGQGSQVSAAAAASTDHPVKQGLVQSFSVYIDTFIVNSSTAFMLLVTGAYNVFTPQREILVSHLPYYVEPGSDFTIYAVDSVFAGFGATIIAIAIFLFAYTIFVTYYYVAETNLMYIMKGKQSKFMLFVLQVLFLFFIFRGSVSPSETAWAMADIGVGITVYLNLIAIIMLYKPLMRCFKDYESQYKKGKNPVFNSKKAGIKNAGFWEK